MKRLCLWLAVLTLAVSQALAGSIPAPTLTPGQHVYTVPAGYQPPMIGSTGLAEIEAAAQACKFPYYVVIAESLNGSSDATASAAINGIADEWSKRADFNAQTASIFLLTYNPRKYRFMAGSKWVAELNFGPDAHEPYTSLFARYAKARDPKTGIIKMMQSVDAMLIDQTDPIKIADRERARKQLAAELKERERQLAATLAAEERQRQLDAARGSLDRQIDRLNTALAAKASLLPSDTQQYRKDLAKAKAVRSADKREAMQAEAQALDSSLAVLERHIYQRREAENAVARRQGAVIFGWILLIGVLAGWLARRMLEYRLSLQQSRSDSQEIEEWCANAHRRFYDWFNGRLEIAGIDELSGKTGELRSRVTSQLDEIFLGISAMKTQLAKCRTAAKSASFFNPRPLAVATRALKDEFDFDTKQVNEEELFAPTTRVVKVRFEQLKKELETKFKTTVEDWRRLTAALDARFKQPEELFPQNTLDTMLAKATEYGIPHAWLAQHPLFGDATADTAFYAQIGQNRLTDPLAYLETIEATKAEEEALCATFDRLTEALDLAKQHRLPTGPTVNGTVLQPQHNPVITFETARRLEIELAGLIARRAPIEDIMAQAKAVASTYATCTEQVVRLNKAVANCQAAIEQAEKDQATANREASHAQTRLRSAAREHLNLKRPNGAMTSGKEYIAAGDQALDRAKRRLADLRHMEAELEAGAAIEQYQEAKRQFAACMGACETLDRQKSEYTQRLGKHKSKHDRLARSLREYGDRRTSLALYTVPSLSGPADYGNLLTGLNQVEEAWDRPVLRAKQSYEAEQARLRRQQEEEEAEARRRRAAESSSYSYGSSSSGSSWGGSSSSDSGSSWSSGSSDSGGSWGGSSDSGSSDSGGSW